MHVASQFACASVRVCVCVCARVQIEPGNDNATISFRLYGRLAFLLWRSVYITKQVRVCLCVCVCVCLGGRGSGTA